MTTEAPRSNCCKKRIKNIGGDRVCSKCGWNCKDSVPKLTPAQVAAIRWPSEEAIDKAWKKYQARTQEHVNDSVIYAMKLDREELAFKAGIRALRDLMEGE